jgi:arginyl-tRNA synthetase
MTQDIVFYSCVKDFQIGGMVYTVGNEQELMLVLFLILKKLGLIGLIAYIFIIRNGRSTFGKMKSHEGTVVDGMI